MRPIFARDGFYFVISSIPEECGFGWRPVAVDPGPWGTCFGAPGERGSLVGDVLVPPGLMEGEPARWTSGRHSSNNVLVYWSEDSLERPSGGAGCWLFDSSARSWSANRGLAGGGGGMPRYFRHRGAAAAGGFRWSLGLFSGPAFRPAGGPGLSCRVGASAGVAAGPRGRPPDSPESWPWRQLFCPFCPAFSGPGGCRRPRARRKITGPPKTDLCKKSARGYPATGCRVYALGSVQ